VRHVRMLGVCVAAVFAMSAVALVSAVPALAKGRIVGDGPGATTHAAEWELFEHCPFHHTPQINKCIWGESAPGSEFTAGNVTVHFNHPIQIQGGALEEVYENEKEELVFTEHFYPPEDGTPVISKVAQTAPSLENDVEPALLSEQERKHYEHVVAVGHTKVTATVEVAGNPTEVFLDEGNLLDERGVALSLPVKIKLSNYFLGKECYVGSDAKPVFIELTTGLTKPPPPNEPIHGSAGHISVPGHDDKETGHTLQILKDTENVLLDNEYAAPGVEGCGKEGAANAALDAKLGLPSAAGHNVAVIHGILEQAGPKETEEAFQEFGI